MKKKYIEISKYVFDCDKCPTRCDGKSKGTYNFENDVKFSEKYENLIIREINNNPEYSASKCLKKGYPDIVIKEKNTNKLSSYIEIKVQRRTFMPVKKILPDASLAPSETLALNLSDLLRYFKIQHETNVPILILWVLMNRPCIVNSDEIAFFYQSVGKLEEIYLKHGDKRRFRRKSGTGDVVEGVHKGVVVNYHFSLNELKKKEVTFY